MNSEISSMKQFISDSIEFVKICHKLKQTGYKKKDIARVLDIPAPVLSSLLKTVLPSVCAIRLDLPEDKIEAAISDAFSLVNNLSRTKIVRRLSADTINLVTLLEENTFTQNEKLNYLDFIRQQSEISYNFLNKYFKGIYYFYYLSSDNYQLKADPFMIKPNIMRRIVEVYKGNEQSNVCYWGIALINNNHTITMQLSENQDSPEEYLQVVLSLPFIRRVEYLRGIFSNLNFARQPIARKVVLHKVSDLCDSDSFNLFPVKRFSSITDVDIPEIGKYLHSNDAKIECNAISKPRFNFSDLDYEIKTEKKLDTE